MSSIPKLKCECGGSLHVINLVISDFTCVCVCVCVHAAQGDTMAQLVVPHSAGDQSSILTLGAVCVWSLGILPVTVQILVSSPIPTF